MVSPILFLSLLPLISSFTRLSYSEIESKIALLQKTCGTLLNVTTAQDSYGVPTPSDCDGCKHYILEFTAAEEGAPQVFFSGALHGDERLGPVTTIALAEFLCSSFPTNPWVRHLVTTRRILLMPMPNPQGYFRNNRVSFTQEEQVHGERVDPNRDFGYFVQPNECMVTTTARAIYELMVRRIVVLSVTFHGGTSAVGYPWGAPNHMIGRLSSEAPDKVAAHSIGGACIEYSNITTSFGPMTDTVYEVAGGMEDWSYAASWETGGTNSTPVTNCHTSEFSIPSYNSWSFRQLMYLVEMDNDKNPPNTRMGEDEDIFNDPGLVPSFLRFSLAAITMVKPYVDAYLVPVGRNEMKAIWRVRGCERVSSTYLLVAPYSPSLLLQLTSSSPIASSTLSKFHRVSIPQQGSCSLSTPHTFNASISLNETSIVLVAAQVDPHWKDQVHPDPAVPPQSHIVKMRTQDGYFVQGGEFTLIGTGTTVSGPMVFNATALSDTLKVRLKAVLYDEEYREAGVVVMEAYSKLQIVMLEVNVNETSRAQLGIGEFGDIRNSDLSTWGHVIPISRLSCEGVPDIGYFSTPYELTFPICAPNPLPHFIGRSAVLRTPKGKLFGVFEAVEAEIGWRAGGLSEEGVCVFPGILGTLLLDAAANQKETEVSGYFYGDTPRGNYSILVNDSTVPMAIYTKINGSARTDRVVVKRNIKTVFGRSITLICNSTVISTCVVGVLNPGHSDPLLTHPHSGGRKLSQSIYVISGSALVCFLALLGVVCYCNGQKRNYAKLTEQQGSNLSNP